MDVSEFSKAKQHDIQHLLIVLDQLGKYFGLNRDIYYTLGQYLGYSHTFLLTIESQNDPLSWTICSTCVKMDPAHITEFVSKFRKLFYSLQSLGQIQLFYCL